MKKYSDIEKKLVESRGSAINMQWLNDNKPVMTKDGRQVIVMKIDLEQVPNVIIGQVKVNDNEVQEYEWNEFGICLKAVDKFGNPKRPDTADNLVMAS